MQIVIDIPDHIYHTVVETGKFGYYRFDTKKAIKNGTPLRRTKMQLVIEYINGDKEEFYVDDCCEGKDCLKYFIRYGFNSGEYCIPYSSIKRWKVCR